MGRIGYARCSTLDQHPEVQEQMLKKAGCEKIFTDHGSSGVKASRPEWDKCIDFLRPGDQLVAVRLDRFGRSVRNLVDVIAELGSRNVDLVVLDQSIDTTTPGGKLVFHVLAAIAEFERDLIVARTQEGLAATTKRGRNGGRKARLTEAQRAQAKRLRADGYTIREIGELLGNGKPVSKQTVYRALGNVS